MEQQIVKCPFHGHEYDLETGLLYHISGGERLVRYDVKVIEGRVLVSSRGK
jgi:nitrite reductase/ring-hydroxylating ferredoxin subunit